MRLALTLTLALALPAFADSLPFLTDKEVTALATEISGDSAKRNLEGLARQHRMRGSRGFHAATENSSSPRRSRAASRSSRSDSSAPRASSATRRISAPLGTARTRTSCAGGTSTPSRRTTSARSRSWSRSRPHARAAAPRPWRDRAPARDIKLDGDKRYEALNLVDGRRSAADIAEALTAIYGPTTREDVEQYLAALAGIDVIIPSGSAP